MVIAVAAVVVAGVVAEAGVEVAAVVVVTMAVVLVSPLTLYRPSATVLIHFVMKLIFPKKMKIKIFMARTLLALEHSSVHQKM